LAAVTIPWLASPVATGVTVGVAVAAACGVAVGVKVAAGVVVAVGTVPLALDDMTTGKKTLSAACKRIQPVKRISKRNKPI
jgi:uncharacterized membrane protein